MRNAGFISSTVFQGFKLRSLECSKTPQELVANSVRSADVSPLDVEAVECLGSIHGSGLRDSRCAKAFYG